jgi:FkbM family methyltransferase
MGFVLHVLREGDLFVDVGANVGAYSILAASLPGTRCIAFEPASDTYQLLLENVQLNNYASRVTTHRIAIGNEDGETLLTAALDTVNHVASATDAGVAQESVPLRRLDTVLATERPAVIKIDVEGYETHVIEGAIETLRDHSLMSVVLEMNGSGLRYGLDEERLDEALLAQGFTPLSYDPLSRQLIPLPEVNASGNRIYVRDREAVQKRLLSAQSFTLPDGRHI